MQHLVRAGIILGAVMILVFVVPRVVPIPVELEPFGFYPKNSEGNAREWASLPAQYLDPQFCHECHQNKQRILENSEHSPVTCENCHGPGRQHMEEGTKPIVDISREACATCHGRVLGRPVDFPQVNLNEHGGISKCISCHNPHKPGRGPMIDITHAIEGYRDCLSCHNDGSRQPFPEDHIGNTNDICLSCHGSK